VGGSNELEDASNGGLSCKELLRIESSRNDDLDECDGSCNDPVQPLPLESDESLLKPKPNPGDDNGVWESERRDGERGGAAAPGATGVLGSLLLLDPPKGSRDRRELRKEPDGIRVDLLESLPGDFPTTSAADAIASYPARPPPTERRGRKWCYVVAMVAVDILAEENDRYA